MGPNQKNLSVNVKTSLIYMYPHVKFNYLASFTYLSFTTSARTQIHIKTRKYAPGEVHQSAIGNADNLLLKFASLNQAYLHFFNF